MFVYRLEHWSSRKGPFEHKTSRQKSPPQDALAFIYSDARTFMHDLDTRFPVVKDVLKTYPHALFAWAKQEDCDRMILDQVSLDKLGFVKVAYEIDHDAVLFSSSESNQIIFDPRKVITRSVMPLDDHMAE